MYKENLFNLVRRGQVTLWVGAGLSTYAGYPSGWELSQLLFKDLNASQRQTIPGYSEQTSTSTSLALPDMAEYYCRIKGGKRGDLIRLLRKAMPLKAPQDPIYHEMIAKISHFKTIITTNYDNLFEQTYGNRALAISNEKNIPYVNDREVAILKVHGDLNEPDSILISSSDYSKFFGRQTENNGLWTYIKAEISTRSILFVGYGMEDLNVNAIYDRIFDAIGTHLHQSFLVAPGFSQTKIDHLRAQGIHYIDRKGEDLFEEMLQELRANVLDDLRHNRIDIGVATKFALQHGLQPTISASSESVIIENLSPTNGKFEGTMSLALDSSNPKNELLNEFFAGRGPMELELGVDDLSDSSFWLNGLQFLKKFTKHSYYSTTTLERGYRLKVS